MERKRLSVSRSRRTATARWTICWFRVAVAGVNQSHLSSPHEWRGDPADVVWSGLVWSFGGFYDVADRRCTAATSATRDGAGAVRAWWVAARSQSTAERRENLLPSPTATARRSGHRQLSFSRWPSGHWISPPWRSGKIRLSKRTRVNVISVVIVIVVIL